VLFDYIDNGILKMTRGTLNGKADRAEGLLCLQDTDTSLITFRKKVTRARISDSATDEQVLTHETKGKKTQLYTLTLKMFWLQRPQETYTYLKQIVPTGSGISRGRSSTLGVVSTLGRIWPGLIRRHGRKDLHLKGGSQHRAWALDSRVKPLDLG
jgi:hypothetical protein